MNTPRCVTVGGSDSGGGAGVQADLKAFAANGCHGMSALTAVTAQNTRGITHVLPVPPAMVVAQLEAIFSDIGCDTAKTGMLWSPETVEAVAGFFQDQRVPLVVDPVLASSSGSELTKAAALPALRERLIPLASVVTPNLAEAEALAPGLRDRAEMAEAIQEMGARTVIITGGHGPDTTDHFYDGSRHLDIAVQRYDSRSTHGSGCTHSASVCALLAQGRDRLSAAYGAAAAASAAIARGLDDIGEGEGPVDLLDLGRLTDTPIEGEATRAAFRT